MTTTAAQIAEQFHEAYERLAPQFGYVTRPASAVPWAEVPESNRRLMEAVVNEVLGSLLKDLAQAQVDRLIIMNEVRAGLTRLIDDLVRPLPLRDG